MAQKQSLNGDREINKRRTLLIGLGFILLVAVGLVAVFFLRPYLIKAYTPLITDAAGDKIPGSIAVIETVALGGFEQTITIRGVDITNPVLLFLHGGPGMPSSPWATWNGYHSELEEHFVLVHWDQREAGKSLTNDLTSEDMHMEDFVSDTLELTDILRERFGREKIFLWGHSWGSGLGFEVLQVNSEPYYTFFASVVRTDWNTGIEMAHEKVLEMDRQANDAEAIEALETIQPFEPTNMEHLQVHFKILSQYRINDFHTEGMEDAWLDCVLSQNSPKYPPSTIKPTLVGMDFTRQTIYLDVINSGFDLALDFPLSTISVHFLHRRYDYACPGVLVEEYYNMVEAPEKSFTWFENSAHDVYYEEPQVFNQKFIKIVNETLLSFK
jgi:pimeloyl-ACP methyl ester carboxylesterase